VSVFGSSFPLNAGRAGSGLPSGVAGRSEGRISWWRSEERLSGTEGPERAGEAGGSAGDFAGRLPSFLELMGGVGSSGMTSSSKMGSWKAG
jgi:hypothetical protein